MKRFVIGFIVGIGLMYWYLYHGGAVESGTTKWFEDSASRYRDDKAHKAAKEALGESEKRR